MGGRYWLGAALLVAGLGAQPAWAQTHFNFGLMFGDEERERDRGFFPEHIICFTDRQIRDAIAARGYTDIALNAPNDELIQVRAARDGATYLLRYDFCADRIVGAQRIQ